MIGLTRMQKFNAMIAAVMLTSFVAFVVLSAHRGDPWEVDCIACYSQWNDTVKPPVITLACDDAGTVTPIYYTAVTVLPSLVASVLSVVFHEHHANFVESVGVFRWLDYVISSSMMVFLIALLNGVREVLTLTFFTFSQVLLIATGPAVEFLEMTGNIMLSRITLAIGGFIHVVIWTLLFVPFYLSVRDGPDWLPVIYVGLFIAFTSFGIVAFLRTEQYISRVKAEYYYGVLGLAAKIPLQWSIYSAIVVRDSENSSSTSRMVMGIFAIALFFAAASFIYIRNMPEERRGRLNA